MQNPRTLPLAYATLLVLSGVAGLAYEVVWLRSLSNALGSSMLATSIILATFMAGMATGSLFLGRRAKQLRNPLIGYAVLELALAACALLVPHTLGIVSGIDRLGAGAAGTKAVAAAAVLFVPTFIMGGTLPFIAEDMGRRFVQAGRLFNVFYGVHVLGAAGGALLASFALIPTFGLNLTSSLGAIVNLLVALGAWRLARSGTRVELSEESDDSPSVTTGVRESAWLATAFLSGFVILACEVVFVRILVLSLMAKVHSFAIMLSTFLVALSVGSVLASRLPARWIRQPLCLSGILLLGAAGLLLSREVPLHLPLPFLMEAQRIGSPEATGLPVGGLSDFLGSLTVNGTADIQSGEYLRISLFISVLTLFPFVVPLGMLLPIITRRIAFESGDEGKWTGRILFWNTLGSVSGPLVAPYLLIPWLSLQGTLWAFAILLALAGAAWGIAGLRIPRSSPKAAWAVGVVAVTAWIVVADARLDGTPALDCTREGAARLFGEGKIPEILHYEEGATCTVNVVETETGKRILRLDGFEAAASMSAQNLDYLYMRLMAHLPALLFGAEPIERALVICCGTGGTAGAMTLHTQGQVDLVDLHPEVIASLPWFDEWNHGVARNPNCRAIAADGRAHLRGTRDEYDIITLEPMPPQFAGMTQLYSKEFYEGCDAALNEGGLVCQWLPLHLVTREQGLAMMRAMAEVFTTVQYWEHAGNGILIGTQRPELQLDWSAIERLGNAPQVQSDLEQGKIDGLEALMSGFICDARDMRDTLRSVDPIRDDQPALEYGKISYGLHYPPQDELARRRQPFYEAALRSVAPVTGFEHAELIQGFVRSVSIERYARMLVDQNEPIRAREFLRQELRRYPDLPRMDYLQGLVAEADQLGP